MADPRLAPAAAATIPQLSGIQRMIEDGEPCLKIGQQFAAVRKALDSTYLRMTVCFMEQELESRLAPDEE